MEGMKRNDTRLEVLISTLGEEGLRRVANHRHPAMIGVRYTVCVQTGSYKNPEIPESLRRDDFTIGFIEGMGLSHNRNHLLSIAKTPYILISDDDVDYSEGQLDGLISVVDSHPGISLFAFQYLSGSSSKRYPPAEFDLAKPPKGYYPSSIEITCRLEDIKSFGIGFDTRFGIGAEFPAGEEELFVHAVLKAGLKGRYFPIPICRHDTPSTGDRQPSQAMIRSKAAVIRRIHPHTWPVRMFMHAVRNSKQRSNISFVEYIRFWMSGVR